MNPILASMLTMLLPLIQRQINSDLFVYIETEIESFIGYTIPGDETRRQILESLDAERGWTQILVATPQWLFNLAIYAVKAKFLTKGG
ncbi:MAG: hypothetical protein HC888_00965 [Candidatus Competibacteraceae bacterium]|nr:hypothetical protein [Candidatus Competibacteraceae bacterium]